MHRADRNRENNRKTNIVQPIYFAIVGAMCIRFFSFFGLISWSFASHHIETQQNSVLAIEKLFGNNQEIRPQRQIESKKVIRKSR